MTIDYKDAKNLQGYRWTYTRQDITTKALLRIETHLINTSAWEFNVKLFLGLYRSFLSEVDSVWFYHFPEWNTLNTLEWNHWKVKFNWTRVITKNNNLQWNHSKINFNWIWGIYKILDIQYAYKMCAMCFKSVLLFR